MPPCISLQSAFKVVAVAAALAALAWTTLVDLEVGPGEAARACLGLTALWAPAGAVVYLVLRGRVHDPLSRAVLAAAASYALTTPLYGAFAVVALWAPGFDRMFYVAQAALLIGSLAIAWRRKTAADLESAADTRNSPGRSALLAKLGGAWRRLDATLLLLIALGLLATERYKHPFETLPDGSHRLATHGDVTYLTAQSYELARQTPAMQQSMRAGIKERAYHMYSHLTVMLVARYTGQDDMLRALSLHEFTAVELFLCLLIFAIVEGVTHRRAAGYMAVATTFLLAIPLEPLLPNGLGYFYFTWHTHASSNVEAAVICSPQMYCALPVVFGLMLAISRISINLSRREPLGALALLAALMAGAMLRFRVQTFLLILPDLLLLLFIAWLRTRDRRLIWAGLAGIVAAGAQVAEMRLPLYYPETCELLIHSTNIMHTVPYLQAWPGAELVREWLREHASPLLFRHGWQVISASMFVMLDMIGLTMLAPALWCVGRPMNWRGESWAFFGMVLWMTIGSVVGSTCIATTYDFYSVGGQMLLMTGWYVLPVAVIGFWQIAHRPAERVVERLSAAGWPGARLMAPVLGLAVVVAACGWQRARGISDLQAQDRLLHHHIVSGRMGGAALYARRAAIGRRAAFEKHAPQSFRLHL